MKSSNIKASHQSPASRHPSSAALGRTGVVKVATSRQGEVLSTTLSSSKSLYSSTKPSLPPAAISSSSSSSKITAHGHPTALIRNSIRDKGVSVAAQHLSSPSATIPASLTTITQKLPSISDVSHKVTITNGISRVMSLSSVPASLSMATTVSSTSTVSSSQPSPSIPLSKDELMEEHSRFITDKHPGISSSYNMFIVREGEFRRIEASHVDHTAFHYEFDGCLDAWDSPIGKDIINNLKNKKIKHGLKCRFKKESKKKKDAIKLFDLIGTSSVVSVASVMDNCGISDSSLPSSTLSTNDNSDSDSDCDVLLHNDFNFKIGICQTSHSTSRSRLLGMEPPPSRSYGGNATQAEIYDWSSRGVEIGVGKNLIGNHSQPHVSSLALTPSSTSLLPFSSSQFLSSLSSVHQLSIEDHIRQSQHPPAIINRLSLDYFLSSKNNYNNMKRVCMLMERMLYHNADADILTDYRYWNDAADQWRHDGSLLPLWTMSYASVVTSTSRVTSSTLSPAPGLAVTTVCWNAAYMDLIAVGYGVTDFSYGMGIHGCIAFYSLKNPSIPYHTLVTSSSVLSLSFHATETSLLAVGLYDGGVMMIDIRPPIPSTGTTTSSSLLNFFIVSSLARQCHRGPVSQVEWFISTVDRAPIRRYGYFNENQKRNWYDTDDRSEGYRGQQDDHSSLNIDNLNFFSISMDGRIMNWKLVQFELRGHEVMTVKLQPSVFRMPASMRAEHACHHFSNMLFNNTKCTHHMSKSDGSGNSGVSEIGDGSINDSNLFSLFHGFNVASLSCISWNSNQNNEYLIGTNMGAIYRCSTDVIDSVLEVFQSHYLSIVNIAYHPCDTDIFISASDDGMVLIWMTGVGSTGPLITLKRRSPIADVIWSPHNSTIFSIITDDGYCDVYDLASKDLSPSCHQRLVSSANKLTTLRYNPMNPIVAVGDITGTLHILKLSPNLYQSDVVEAPGDETDTATTSVKHSVDKSKDGRCVPPIMDSDSEIKKLLMMLRKHSTSLVHLNALADRLTSLNFTSES